MEVHCKPDVQAKLEQLARESGRPSGELVEDALLGYFDEVAQTREILDRRFGDLESGRVKPVDGDEAYRLLFPFPAARHRWQGYSAHPRILEGSQGRSVRLGQ